MRSCRSPNPTSVLVETSFCGFKSLPPRQDSRGGEGRRPSLARVEDSANNGVRSLQPVRYVTEPRSRPISPCCFDSASAERRDSSKEDANIAAVAAELMEELRLRIIERSPSPNRKMETSFCGSKRAPSQDTEPPLPAPPPPDHRTAPDRLSQPVRYQTEPRSRPASPNIAADLMDELRSRRSPSPNRMIETSFCGSKRVVARQESEHIPTPPPEPKTAAEKPAQPVKYQTEPRPVSPNVAAADFMDELRSRITRSPSPNRMIETSFCGSKQRVVTRQESGDHLPPATTQPHDESQLRLRSVPPAIGRRRRRADRPRPRLGRVAHSLRRSSGRTHHHQCILAINLQLLLHQIRQCRIARMATVESAKRSLDQHPTRRNGSGNQRAGAARSRPRLGRIAHRQRAFGEPVLLLLRLLLLLLLLWLLWFHISHHLPLPLGTTKRRGNQRTRRGRPRQIGRRYWADGS